MELGWEGRQASSWLALPVVLIGQQAAVDGVRSPPFQAPQGFLGRLALGQLALVVGLPAAGSADLDHGHHVQGMVELAVP